MFLIIKNEKKQVFIILKKKKIIKNINLLLPKNKRIFLILPYNFYIFK